MAIQKTINYDNGTSAAYHRISGVTLYFSEDGVHVDTVVWSYTTQPQRQLKPENPVVIERHSKVLTESEFMQVSNIRSEMYEHLKTLPEFENATDC